MKKIWRCLRFLLFAFLAVVALAAGLFGYFVFTPNPQVPALSGTLIPGSLDAGGLTRTYSTYVPRGLANGAPLVLVMHGAGESGSRIGGMVSLFGFSYKYGRVMSSRASAEYFSNLNHIVDPPETNATSMSDGIRVETLTWGKSSNVEVELVLVEGGGHGIPQPYRRHPRLLGPSPKEPNGPGLIWAFFDRQRR